MNIVLLGPPGAGKGTQAKFIAARLSLEHISSGDLLREAIRNGTDLGKKAKSYMDKGSLVPDELVVDLIKEKVTGKGSKKGFLLDGFPRTLAQAKVLKTMLLDIKNEIKFALNIRVSDELILKRLSGRRVCEKCGQPFNIFFSTPRKEGKCDACGEELIQRDDDTIGTIRERLTNYKSMSQPILEFYKREGLLKEVDGDRDIKDVSNDIEKLLKV